MQSRIVSLLYGKNSQRYSSLAAFMLLTAGYAFSRKEESNVILNTTSLFEKNIHLFSLKAFYTNLLRGSSNIYTMEKKKMVHDSDDSESDVEDFHTPSLDSDTENEFIDDDSGFLVETDSEEEIITSADDTDSDT